MKQFISQFIPIVALFLLLAYSKKMAVFSNSILGKFIAVAIVIFYTYQNKLLGLLACTLFIFYYQSDSVENMLNIEDMTEGGYQDDPLEIVDDGLYLHKENDKNRDSKEPFYGIEKMDEYSELTNGTTGLAQEEFRKENCKGNVLKHKGMVVPNDMSTHVFPELKFKSDYPCNPCNKSCVFSIVETKIKTEEKLVKPVFSADTM
jgi:hypothetical protein